MAQGEASSTPHHLTHSRDHRDHRPIRTRADLYPREVYTRSDSPPRQETARWHRGIIRTTSPHTFSGAHPRPIRTSDIYPREVYTRSDSPPRQGTARWHRERHHPHHITSHFREHTDHRPIRTRADLYPEGYVHVPTVHHVRKRSVRSI